MEVDLTHAPFVELLDYEIPGAIASAELLHKAERHQSKRPFDGPSLADYLYRRTIAEHKEDNGLLSTIRRTVNAIITKIGQDSEQLRLTYIRELCFCAANPKGAFMPQVLRQLLAEAADREWNQ